MAERDIVWRRPDPPAGKPSDYSGPPVGEAPPADWRLPVPEPTAPPRELPDIDHDAVDDAEQKAARFTYAIAFVALGVITLVVCWRAF